MKTKGWQKIFSFTFVQYVKSKSFIVGTVVTCVIIAAICALTNILPAQMMEWGDLSNVEVSETQDFLNYGKVHLFDHARILTSEDMELLEQTFEGGVTVPDKPLETVLEEIKDSESAQVAVEIAEVKDEDGKIAKYAVTSNYTQRAQGSADIVNGVVSDLINRRILLNAGVAPEKYEDTQISVETLKTAAGSQALNVVQGAVNNTVPMFVSIILFMLIFMYGTAVAQSIATEKTSRVMELLLTSVRPLAIVIGKVLAMGLVAILQFLLLVLVGVGAFAASSPWGWVSGAMELLKNPEVQEALSQNMQMAAGVSGNDLMLAQIMNMVTKAFTPMNIVLVVIIFLLGFLFFALIAALFGASISRMEDLQAAMSPYSIIGVVGFYLSAFPTMFQADAMMSGDSSQSSMQLFANFFPLSSPFALPSSVFLGTMDMPMIIAGIAVLAVCIVLIAVLVAKVYEAIILYNGNRIKFGDMLKMATRK